MSRELVFYPAFKDKETGKYKSILTDVDGNPASVLWRSQSFIDMDFFTTKLFMISEDEFDDSCKEYFLKNYNDLYKSLNNQNLENFPTYIYELTEDILYKIGESNGVVSGYIPIEELKVFYQVDSSQEYLTWEMSTPLPGDVFLELPDEEKRKYGKIYTIDTYSKEYICSILSEVLDDIYIPYTWKGEKCILVYYSF